MRPTPPATASTPLTWAELARGARTEAFTIRNVPARVAGHGDLWKPLLMARGRTNLDRFLSQEACVHPG